MLIRYLSNRKSLGGKRKRFRDFEMSVWLCVLLALDIQWVSGRPAASGEELLLGTSTKASMLGTHINEVHEDKEPSPVLVLLNDDLSSGNRFHTYLRGTAINIEAHVDFSSGADLKIYVDECYGSHKADLRTSGKTHALVHKHGCLVDGKFGNSSFWSRTNNSIIFTVQAFMLTERNEEQVYIHCSLGVWNLKSPVGPSSKSCSYDLFSSRWRLLENSTLNSICTCCETACPAQNHPAEHGKALYNVALGPLTVRKSHSGWWEERCQSLKRFLLACTAFVGSCLLGALFTGTLLVCALSLGSYCRRRKMVIELPESPYPPVPRAEKKSTVDCNENDNAIEE
ncbi:zona pellucida sperm-binding protein 3-like [Ambystoma mexicanum]|uniref:zona pellucida sperm-binding protein 3-like n=1 Tax=Ambystoma mexicanum TaxID=8296 RepID=UPI0037E93BDB